jgi:glycosyltransferase involved in cell wall biosynthesis
MQRMNGGLFAARSAVGINSELIRHGGTGFLAADAEAWREALLALAADPTIRDTMGRNGRELLARAYSQAIYAGKYARNLFDLLT